ncbi:glycosyltransferase family 2 protein [Porphyromonas circumdentaria]|uniref:Glycosyl transferase family 2 n=1 Tax=Porphyromonas circumdentaria TaxID=29524 RepID=A0A1T4KYV4_9PORP|nr:glycosyltransferase family 2 protein [Porphyromonas circumdentaria]MBB6275140.1 glycosyltransferase involved in cell wall biosynthesis [Porphyromonas circumdentaria]SJZ47609.1 Glycosyl transferase family 2 [Porphyromonas circumdentaria]
MESTANLLPTLSIVIPVYNVQDYLHRCVESIFEQDYHDYEIILVDDGATDSSGAICDKLAKEHSSIRVIHKPNGGLSSARNAGLQRAVGKYIWFIDSDDYIASGCLLPMMNQIEKAEAEILFFRFLRTDGSSIIGVPVGKYYPGHYSGREVVLNEMANHTAWSFISLKSLWDVHGLNFLEGIVFEDFEIWPQLMRVVQKSVFFDSEIVPYRYFMRPDSIMNQSNPEKKLKQIEDHFRIEESWREHFNLVTPAPDSYDMVVLKESTRVLHRCLLTFTTLSKLSSFTKLKLLFRYRKKGVFSNYYNGHRRHPYIKSGKLKWVWNIIGRSFIAYALYSIVRDIIKE